MKSGTAGDRASAWREHMTGVWDVIRYHQQSLGAEPHTESKCRALIGVRERSPPEAENFIAQRLP